MGVDLDRMWLPPPVDLALSTDEIHVWRASLDLPASRVDGLQQTLAPDELSKAERFRFQKDRQRFIVTRALLRAILSRYLDTEPGELRFSISEYGKPALIPPSAQDTINFNVSHSHRLALYAITHNDPVGIDLEYIRPLSEVDQIAKRSFSAQENAVFSAFTQTQKLEAFFKYWTRKEAYLKAIGEGLSLPMDQFDVSLDPGESVNLSSVRGDSQEVSRWFLRELIPATGYVAALAMEGNIWKLACWSWPEEMY
jgi:4'-phosphopantetheinyl transferase